MKRKFTDIVSFVGAAPSRFLGEKRYISTGAVDCFSVNEAEVQIISYDSRPSRANLTAQTNDILFAKMAETQKTLLLDERQAEDIYSTGFCAVKANEQIISPQCLYYLVSSPTFLLQKDKHASGATQRAITNAGMTNINVNVPSLEEQDKIVKFLNRITSLTKKRKKQIFLIDELVKSKFIEMFGDLRKNPKKWDFKALCKVCDVRDGTHDSPKYQDTGYPLMTSKNFTNGEVDFTGANLISQSDFDAINKRSKVDVGDIVMPMIGTIGHPVIINTDKPFAIKNVALIKFWNSEVSNIFVKAILDSNYFLDIINEKNKGNTQKFISLGDIRNVGIPIVPKEQQNEFARFVEQTDKVKLTIKNSLEKLELLKKSLMQKYFG